MFKSRAKLLPTNCTLVDQYLNDPALDTLNRILRPVQPFNSTMDVYFRRKTIQYAEEEEIRMESNLRLMAFEIDAPDTLMFVTGLGRIERVSL